MKSKVKPFAELHTSLIEFCITKSFKMIFPSEQLTNECQHLVISSQLITVQSTKLRNYRCEMHVKLSVTPLYHDYDFGSCFA